jgi:hypothetical protein
MLITREATEEKQQKAAITVPHTTSWIMSGADRCLLGLAAESRSSDRDCTLGRFAIKRRLTHPN